MTTSGSETEQADRDHAARPRGFYWWLMHEADGDFEPLRDWYKQNQSDPDVAACRLKSAQKTWLTAINATTSEDDADVLINLYVRAQIEWKTDQIARGKSDRKYELDPVPALNWKDPSTKSTTYCRYDIIDNTGKKRRCNHKSVPGTTRCQRHGGELVDAETRRAVLMTSYLDLVGGSETAVRALMDVAENSRNDLARVAAAKEILDRAGLTPELQVNISLDSGERETKFDRMREKFDEMQKGLIERANRSQALEAGIEEQANEEAGQMVLDIDPINETTEAVSNPVSDDL